MLKSLVPLAALPFAAADVPKFVRPQHGQTIELADGWTLTSAGVLSAQGRAVSSPGYDDFSSHLVPRMPATVLEILREDGVYPDLYVGTNLLDRVPQDLYRQDWWYRTEFTAPAGHDTYLLGFPGINYRAEIWLNGRLVADDRHIVGMYCAHELDVTPWIVRGEPNVLAVKVRPEQAIQDVDGVELADSWFDWINWRYLGYHGPGSNQSTGVSFVADRNAGIWKPVHLKVCGPVALGRALVNSQLPLPATDSAELTVYASLHNYSAEPITGLLRVRITRPGTATIQVEAPVALAPGENREVAFAPADFAGLTLADPDLWWPYTMGEPNLYDLDLEFWRHGRILDARHQRFGIRSVSQHRDSSERYPELGAGGSFYLQVNGRDFLIRGAAYTPDLLYRHDPARETAILRYVKDLGLNMLRLEGKFPGEHLVEQADELGIPLMFGWMCCNQWEKWSQWNEEDHWVARESLRSQMLAFRAHAAAFIWANGSDGHPPPDVLADYRAILTDLHWQNATVDTVSSYARDEAGRPVWDGIQMAGPYSWRPPTYWFDERYAAARGASAEQGDNEHIPPFASLKLFIPPDKLWPINDTWYFHAGSDMRNEKLAGIRLAVEARYGKSSGAEEFTRKAQLAHYESTRAQFEGFAAGGWDDHKMTIYWMLNNHWPSFFGHLFDYYLRPGGAYYGAKKGLRPLSVVFDSYATGDHSVARVLVVNQTPVDQHGVRVRVRVYDLQGNQRTDRTTEVPGVGTGAATVALTLPRVALDSSVFFLRCELFDRAGGLVAENVYWQSQQDDDAGDPRDDFAFGVSQRSWADMTALNRLVKVPLEVSAQRVPGAGDAALIRLRNPTARIAFFARAELTGTRDGEELLPIEYSDNYVTVFPGETVEIRAEVPGGNVAGRWVRVAGYNTEAVVAPVR